MPNRRVAVPCRGGEPASASASDQSPYQPGSQLALPRLTGNLPLYVTMWTRHVDSSCGLVMWPCLTGKLVIWTRHVDSSFGRQTRDQPLSTPTQPTQIPTYQSMGELQKGPIRTSVQPSHLPPRHASQLFFAFPSSNLTPSPQYDPPLPPMFVYPCFPCSLPPRPLLCSRIHQSSS